MHLTLKQEATKPAAANVLQQQARFDAFVAQYNRDRPHQALAMKVAYPFHDTTFTVTQCGRICFKGGR
jgi:hypothetical protein